MDNTINQLEQDLARAEYSERTRLSYCAHARELAEHAGKPISQIRRDELRGFVEVVVGREDGLSRKQRCLCALLFLYRKTLGKPEMVSFIKLPGRHSKLPVVLSNGEVHRLLNAIRSLLDRPSLAQEMGERGRKTWLRLWTPEAHIDAYLGLVDRVIRARRVRAAAASP